MRRKSRRQLSFEMERKLHGQIGELKLENLSRNEILEHLGFQYPHISRAALTSLIGNSRKRRRR